MNRPDMNIARGNQSDGISILDQFETVGPTAVEGSIPSSAPKRPEMNGPSDISDILSGLKTKNINIQNKEQKNSKINIEELNELSDNKPSGKSKKRPKSEKNTISLAL